MSDELNQLLEKVASFTRNIDLERERANGGAKFMVIQGLIAAGGKKNIEFAQKLIDRSIETQLSTGELGFGDPKFYTVPAGIGFGVLEFYQRTEEPRYLEAAKQQLDYILSAPRVENGAFWHNKHSPELWVDSMYIMVPFIARMGEILDDSSLYDEAAKQILGHAEHLQDNKTGLFRHIWRANPNDYPEGSFWGRGNGWAAAGTLEVLELLPEDHPSRKDLREILRKQLQTVVSLQDASGFWWNVLDDKTSPAAFLETSVTTIFAYVIRKSISEGLISEDYLNSAERAFNVILGTVNDRGVVTGATYVTHYDPDVPLRGEEVFSISGYAQGWFLKTASFFKQLEHN